MELTNVLRGAESLLNLPLSQGDITSALEVLNRIWAELEEREEANKMKSYVVHAEVGVTVKLEVEARSENDAKEALSERFRFQALETSDRELEIVDEDLKWNTISVELEDVD